MEEFPSTFAATSLTYRLCMQVISEQCEKVCQCMAPYVVIIIVHFSEVDDSQEKSVSSAWLKNLCMRNYNSALNSGATANNEQTNKRQSEGTPWAREVGPAWVDIVAGSFSAPD